MDTQESNKSFDELRDMVKDIVSTAKETGNFDPELQKEVNMLSVKIEKTEIDFQTHKLLEQQKSQKEKKDQNED